jgi:hypothetical protein
MKSVRLYLFKTESFNFVNLLQFCFILSRRDLYQPCLPLIAGTNLLVTTGEFVNTLSPDNPYNFRNIDWSEKLNILNSTLTQTDKPIVIGHNDINQLLFLEKQYSSIAQTISCSYTKDDYDLILTYFANMHLMSQSNGTVPLTEHDLQLRADQSINLLFYYKNAFDQQGLIPRSMLYSTDYNVPLKDFLDKNKFFQHLVNLGAEPTPEAIHYYNQWWELQHLYFYNGENK